jgi:EmrB/QacA subfamily drug resistance transporter
VPTTMNIRARWTALMVLCAGMLMIILDATVVNVALPSIQDELNFTQAGLAWVVNAYLIAFAGLLLLAGRLGDLLSRRGVFLAGLVVFTGASLVCGLAGSRSVLIAARFVQGVGGALTSAVILGMIVTMFTEPRERAKAIGIYSFVASAGGSLGLLAGGALTEAINWHWIFFINVPIGLVTGVAAVKILPKDSGIGLRAGTDVLGAALITGALMLGVYSVVQPNSRIWTVAALALLLLFVVREATARRPLMPLRIFRSYQVTAANIIQILAVAGMFGMFFLGVLYLRDVLGYDALHTGLAFVPLTLVMGIISLRYSAPLLTRFGPRRLPVAGLGLAAIGMVLFAQVPVHGTYLADVLPAMLLIGTGMGIAVPGLATLAMSTATEADAGLASGLVNTTAQIGSALGVAVLATLSADRTATLLAGGSDQAVALSGGYRLALLVGAALVVVAIAVSSTLLRMRKPQPVAASAAVEGPPDTLQLSTVA